MSVPRLVLDVLIGAGHEPTLDVGSIPAELESIRNEHSIDRLQACDWDDVTQPMVLEDVVALVKALVVCEERFGWQGGSVSAIIWVYREIERRDHVLAEGIAEWILLRTSNPWVPFGSTNLGARSLREYRALQAVTTERKAERARLEVERKARATANREQRKEAGIRRQALQRQDTRERRAWVGEFLSVPAAEQLRRICEDVEHPLDYFPASCTEASHATLRALSPDVRYRLLRRLEGHRKGPWRRLYLALRAAGD
jgi:hypothetical protein